MSSYEFYLRQMARLARANGLTPVFSTLVSNLAYMEPNFPLDELVDEQEPAAAEGRLLERNGRWRHLCLR